MTHSLDFQKVERAANLVDDVEGAPSLRLVYQDDCRLKFPQIFG